MRETQNIGNHRPPLRAPHRRSDVARTRKVMVHGRGPQRRRANANGYQLQRHPINFSGRRAVSRLNPWAIILGALVLVAVILLVVALTTALSQCSASPQDPVADDAPASVTDGLTQAVRRGHAMDTIAADAGSYPEGLIALALAQPDAVDFVAGWPDAEKDFRDLGDQAVTKGQVTTLWAWDERWGYATYGEGPVALTGSGPLCLSSISWAITGTTDVTPKSVAELAEGWGAAQGDSGTDATLLQQNAAQLDLSIAPLTATDDGSQSVTDQAATDDSQEGDAQGDGSGPTDETTAGDDAMAQALVAALDGGYVLVETDGGQLGDASHWVVVSAVDGDGAVVVMDPTSTQNNAHSWDPATVVGDARTLLVVRSTRTDEGTQDAGSQGTEATSSEKDGTSDGTGGTATSGVSSR